jgi:flagellar basal-body rod protein FlgB
MKEVEGEAPMFEKLELIQMAQSLAAHSGARMAVIAENVANADTPGFKAKDLPSFAEVFAADSDPMRSTRPGHLIAGEPALPAATTSRGHESPNGNSVSLEAEMVKSVEARQNHDMALAIYRATSDVIRASLGRNR